jgi:Potential Queuosine, Q, salvage protein family
MQLLIMRSGYYPVTRASIPQAGARSAGMKQGKRKDRLGVPLACSTSTFVAGCCLCAAVTWLRGRRRPIAADPLAAVKASTARVLAGAREVSLDKAAIARYAHGMSADDLRDIAAPAAFDAELHYVDGTWRTVQYLLVVDCLNFCFWPRAHPDTASPVSEYHFSCKRCITLKGSCLLSCGRCTSC